jgi:uracil phosphoribosyltransferase
MAIDVLKSRGVPEEHILFLNLIASPEGAQNLAEQFPKVRVVTAFVDAGLDEKKYVCLLFHSFNANNFQLHRSRVG